MNHIKKAVDTATRYLASRGALHKLNTPVQVIGKDISLTIPLLHRLAFSGAIGGTPRFAPASHKKERE